MRKKIISVIGGHDWKLKVEQATHYLAKKLAKVGDTKG
jgi:hypothetical protein